MKIENGYIRTGFFEDFKGYDTILISVDTRGLLEMENLFISLSGSTIEFDLATLSCTDHQFKIQIKAFQDDSNSGMNRIGSNGFEWRVSSEVWSRFREMLTGLMRSGTGGHQYLDAETGLVNLDSLQVVLSLKEYPKTFWDEHFTSNI